MEPKNLETALMTGVEHVLSKKLGGVIVIALLLAKAGAPPWMLFGLGIAYLAAQLGLDAWEKYLATWEPANPIVARADEARKEAGGG